MNDRTARTPGLTVRVRGLTTQKHLSVESYWAQGAKDITRKRVKALAANALDAVGQPQTRSTPSRQLHKLTKQEGSLGE